MDIARHDFVKSHMSQKILNWVVAIVFSIIALIHLVRSILGWDVVVGGVSIPVGLSVVAFLLSVFIAYSAFKLIGKDKNLDVINM